jgi:hypothetical protein
VNFVLTPIVGNSFRLSGKLVLPTLPEGQPLILEPEPDNQYDPDAIKVCVDMYGSKYMVNPEEHLIVHLGYIPRSGGRYDVLNFGNKEVLSIISQPNWSANLTFSPEGRALVRLCISTPSTPTP